MDALEGLGFRVCGYIGYMVPVLGVEGLGPPTTVRVYVGSICGCLGSTEGLGLYS